MPPGLPATSPYWGLTLLSNVQVLGACSCDDGWGGPDCSQELKHQSWPPKWLLYSMMVGSIVVSLTLLFASRHVLSDYMERRRIASEENQAMLVSSCTVPVATDYMQTSSCTPDSTLCITQHHSLSHFAHLPTFCLTR